MDLEGTLNALRGGGNVASQADKVLERELGNITNGSIQTFTQVLRIVPNGVFIYMQPNQGEVRASLQIGNVLCRIENFSRVEGNYSFLKDEGVSDRLMQYMKEDLDLIIQLFQKHKKAIPDKIWIANNNEAQDGDEDLITLHPKRTTLGYTAPNKTGDIDENFNNWRYSLEDNGWRSLTNI